MFTIDGVRRRPGMYFGSIGTRGLTALVTEVVSNSLDQVLAGRARTIAVDIRDGVVVVSDDGPGIPVMVQDSGLPFVEEMLTTVRNSPTADGHAPHVHLGYGCGLGPVSAVCSSLTVSIDDGRQRYQQRFGRGRSLSALEIVGPSSGQSGTVLELRPDPELFIDADYDHDALSRILREVALLSVDVTTSFNGATFGPVADLGEMFNSIHSSWSSLVHQAPLFLNGTRGIARVRMALGWTDSEASATVRAFCNYRETQDNGNDRLGIEEGLRLVLGQAPIRKVLAGMVCVLDLTMLDPTFGDPTRHRLDSPEAIWLVADTIAAELPPLLEQLPELESMLRSRVPLRSR